MRKLSFSMTAALIFFAGLGCSHKILGPPDVPEKQALPTTILTFRIDDVDFSSTFEVALPNALSLAKKYNIVFDLGVIAERFQSVYDFYRGYGLIPPSFQFYQNNIDKFEIAAHGLTHQNPIFSKNTGEFYDDVRKEPVPIGIQETHIKKMKEIFANFGLLSSQEIFFVPWHAGDENTIKMAEKYGWRLITLVPLSGGASEMKFGNIFATSVLLDIDWRKRNFSAEEIQNYCRDFSSLLAGNYREIEIVMHPCNFATPESNDKLIGGLVAEIAKTNSAGGKKIKIGFASEVLKNL